MIRYKDLKTGEDTSPGGPLVCALGNFDGVHLGHAEVIRATAEAARRSGTKSAAWFFRDDPGSAPALTFAEEKESLFAELGIDLSVTEDFSDVKDLSPEEFVCRYLPSLGCRGVVCGFNFRFGKGASGDTNMLEALCLENGLSFTSVPPVTVDGVTVSSTKIREALAEGDVGAAAKMLGRRYSLTAPVTHGRTLGTKFGFPTINQYFGEGRAIPRRGVYYTLTKIDGKVYPSVSNAGSRPTVGGHACRLETHILGFEGDLYGAVPTVYFERFRRPEMTFDNESALIEAITADKLGAEGYFSSTEHSTEGGSL